MDCILFEDFWLVTEHQAVYWKQRSQDGLAVSLGELPIKMYKQLLDELKFWHHVLHMGHGNLLNGAHVILGGDVPTVVLENPYAGDPADLIQRDINDFRALVTRVENIVQRGTQIAPPYASAKFHQLYALLPQYSANVDDLRDFGFFIRNNPLFLDQTAKFLLFRKVLNLYEFNKSTFSNVIDLTELNNWSNLVTTPALEAVQQWRKHSNDQFPANHLIYTTAWGSIVFFRNAVEHVRSRNILMDDCTILKLLEDELPNAMPVWYFSIVYTLDYHSPTLGAQMCQCSLIDYLKKPASVFY